MAEHDEDPWLEELREALATAGEADDATDDVSSFDPDDRPGLTDRLPVASGPGEPGAPVFDPPRAAAASAGTEPETGGAAGIAGVHNELRKIGSRLSSLESFSEDIARQTRRGTTAPEAAQIEAVVARVVRNEVAALLDERLAAAAAPTLGPSADESLDRWAERVDLTDASSGDVVVLMHDLRQRISELEQIHRMALEELTNDRRALIDHAVDEIRKLLFGE